MPMENQLAHAITQTEYDLSYDKAAKKLLANKQILAQIMKNCVNEYSACSVDEIAEKYMNEDLEREVLVMCNLSQGVKAEGREEGISIGEMRMLVQLVRDGDLKMERAAEKAKMTVEQFKKVMENTPLQAV